MTEVQDFKNDLSEVSRACEALRALWQRNKLPDAFEGIVTLCLEEVLSNVIRHGCLPGQGCEIQVRYTILDGLDGLDGNPGGIEIEVRDNAVAFNPLTLPPPDIHAPLENRKAGGLGVFLVRQMMDDVLYKYQDGRNHFLFRKRWPETAIG